MRLPRDLYGRELGKKLGLVGYRFSRQVGSHMRFTRDEPPQHSITIPDQNFGLVRFGKLLPTLPVEDLIDFLLA